MHLKALEAQLFHTLFYCSFNRVLDIFFIVFVSNDLSNSEVCSLLKPALTKVENYIVGSHKHKLPLKLNRRTIITSGNYLNSLLRTLIILSCVDHVSDTNFDWRK